MYSSIPHYCLLLSLLLTGTLLVHAQSLASCSYDYQCGNIPYSVCTTRPACYYTINGFAVTNQSIYYVQNCGDYYYFKRIPIAGGPAVDLYARRVIPADANPTRILGVIGTTLYFDILSRYPGLQIKSVDLSNPASQEGDINTGAWTQSIYDFDPFSNSPATYLCNYNPGPTNNKTIERYPVFPASGTVYSQGVLYTLPSLNSCGVIRRHADDLYFTSAVTAPNGTSTTYFFHGLTTCSRCALPAPFFITSERVNAFDVSGGFLFFGSDNGMWRVNLDGTALVKIISGPVTAIELINGIVVYNSAYSINSVDLQGNNILLLSLASALPGSCSCRSGFTGALCDQCVGGQIQWQPSTNIPRCAYLYNGVPSSCYEDYQCGNVPYTVCRSSSCQCISTNFTGTGCNECAAPMQLSWTNGVPSCA